MNSVNIYDDKGVLINSIPLNSELRPLGNGRRVWVDDKGLYYKGAGINYISHNVDVANSNHSFIRKNSEVIYGGYNVKDKRYEGLTGIICEPYQPYFSDYIGGCGPKESKIVNNSVEFELSGVSVKDIIPTIDNHNIYVCDYLAKDGLESSTPDIKNLEKLLDYIINTDWCCPWDKNCYRDIDGLGYLRDPADWFRSNSFINKFGTIYSIIYPMYVKDPKTLSDLFSHIDIIGIPFNYFTVPYVCLALISKYNSKIIPQELLKYYDSNLYIKIVTEYLLNGTYCCHLEDKTGKYDFVRKSMVDKFYRSIKEQ